MQKITTEVLIKKTLKPVITMKKIRFILPLLVLCLASCEKEKHITEPGGVTEDGIIVFTDQNFLKALLTVRTITYYNADLGYYTNYLVDVDINRDGLISVNEAQTVKALDLFGLSLTSIPEIQYFTVLKSLSCANNQLTSLDVSWNKILETLQCSENQLSSLDVANNTALTTLSCYIIS